MAEENSDNILLGFLLLDRWQQLTDRIWSLGCESNSGIRMYTLTLHYEGGGISVFQDNSLTGCLEKTVRYLYSTGHLPSDEEYPDFIRTSGDMICSVCEKTYYKHPRHSKWDFLRQLCDGQLVKL